MTRYTMPAEWGPHAATWVAWPHRKSDWPGKFAPIRWVYGEIVRTLARFEPVNVIVADAEQAAVVRRVLKAAHADLANVTLHELATDRSWLRDSGPTFVRDAAGKRVALDWHFNGWAKYPDWHRDDRVPAFVARLAGVPAEQPHFAGHRVVLEGGSVEVNGAGLLLATEECWLSKTQERNPPLDRAGYEAVCREFLGVEKVLWLDRGIAGDDTHGHIDDLARFVNETTVVQVVEHDEADENYEPLQENLDRLRGMTTTDGRKLTVVELPMPRPFWTNGQRLPASYANFYVGNGAVLVPTFNDPADRVALGTLADHFPDREVIGVHSGDLIYGLGTLHCLTQQEIAE
jgi:agmatine deiminase